MKELEKFDWRKGVTLRQRVPMSHTQIPQQFLVRPYTTRIVTVIHNDDFPVEEMRDMKDFIEWLDSTLAPQLVDGIYYLMGHGWYTAYYKGGREKKNRIWTHKKEEKGFKRKKLYGYVALAKFEIAGGKTIRVFDKRGTNHHAPYNERPTYAIWKLFKGGLKKPS